MHRIIIGVMGPGQATRPVRQLAYQLGKAIAAEGWVTLSGGRNAGVMDEVNRGAKDGGGLTIGILPGVRINKVSEYVDIPIMTGMGSARNNINILTASVVVACGLGAGTASEVALAIKAGKPVILLGIDAQSVSFFQQLDMQQNVKNTESVPEVINLIRYIFSSQKN